MQHRVARGPRNSKAVFIQSVEGGTYVCNQPGRLGVQQKAERAGQWNTDRFRDPACVGIVKNLRFAAAEIGRYRQDRGPRRCTNLDPVQLGYLWKIQAMPGSDSQFVGHSLRNDHLRSQTWNDVEKTDLMQVL